MAPSHRRRLALLGFHVDGGRSRPPALVTVAAAAAADTSSPWATATEDSRCIKVETELLQATIVKNNPKHWMTGVEKHSFVDKATCFHEVGDGLMVIDWLMEGGSDEKWQGDFDRQSGIALDGSGQPAAQGTDRYLWHDASWVRGTVGKDDTDRAWGARMAHGTSHRKRAVEGPQLCHRMPPVQPTIIKGEDFIAVETRYDYAFAAPGRAAGSKWRQLVVFPHGKRYFLLMDEIISANASPELFLRNDTPGCVRHVKGDSFSEMYLSHLGAADSPYGLTIPSSEFFEPFPPDLKFNYRRDMHACPEHFIRGYHLRDTGTGAPGPWLAGITLQPSVVHEAWASQRPGDIIVMIEEVHGRPTQVGEKFSAAHAVGFFDSVQEMHEVAARYHGCTVLTADPVRGWGLS